MSQDKLYRNAVSATVWWYQRKHHTQPPENLTIQHMLDAYNYWNVECLFDDVPPEHTKARDAIVLFLKTNENPIIKK